MSVTGWRWTRPKQQCPQWCGKGHLCTAQHGYSCGEHRSVPLVWRLPYGRLVATRVGTAPAAGGRDRLEVRTTVHLPRQEDAAAWQSYQLAAGIDHAIRTVLGLPAGAGLLTELAHQQHQRQQPVRGVR